MNFRNLQYFLVAAQENNFTRAAKKLYISQQSLSGHIAKLEAELGVELFERGQELRLTYAGERLALLARQVCDLEQEIVRESGEIRGNLRGKIRLGISHTCGRAILPTLLPEFCQAHPLVEISLMEGNHIQLNEWLSKGEIDVLIGYMPINVPGAEVHPFLTERLFLVCPKEMTDQALGSGAPALRRDPGQPFEIERFAGQPFILLKKGNRIRAMLENYFAKSAFIPDVMLETENIETAFSLAARGMGITVYPELFLDTLHPWAFDETSQLDLFPLPGEETVGALAIAFPENGYRSAAVHDFMALCKRTAGHWQKAER